MNLFVVHDTYIRVVKIKKKIPPYQMYESVVLKTW